jgi:phospholipase A2
MTDSTSLIPQNNTKVALVTLVAIGVVTYYFYSRNGKSEKKHVRTRQVAKKKQEESGSLYADFISSLPSLPVTVSSTDEFLGNLFSTGPGSFFPSFDAFPTSLEELGEKIAPLYPNFESQLEAIKEMYASFWDFLSLEDFNLIVQETMQEDEDTDLHPEINNDAHVREGQEISHDELAFIKARKEKIRDAFAFFINVNSNEVHVDDIPTIGIASR